MDNIAKSFDILTTSLFYIIILMVQQNCFQICNLIKFLLDILVFFPDRDTPLLLIKFYFSLQRSVLFKKYDYDKKYNIQM